MMQPQFTRAGITRMAEKKLENFILVILNRLAYIGEAFVADARERGSYNDITGNLRSSIGFMVLREGAIWLESFEGENAEGQQKGRELALQIAERYPKGCVLIVVAGMEYAAAVESRGRDVLTMSSFQAEGALKTALEEIGAKIAA